MIGGNRLGLGYRIFLEWISLREAGPEASPESVTSHERSKLGKLDSAYDRH
jgi:hypothetical protein